MEDGRERVGYEDMNNDTLRVSVVRFYIQGAKVRGKSGRKCTIKLKVPEH